MNISSTEKLTSKSTNAARADNLEDRKEIVESYGEDAVNDNSLLYENNLQKSRR